MSFFILYILLHFYWYGHDRAQVLLLVWPPQWHGHTDTVIGMAGGHTGLMQRYAPAGTISYKLMIDDIHDIHPVTQGRFRNQNSDSRAEA